MKYSIHRRRIVAAAAAAMAAGFVRFPEVARSATPKEKVIGITTKRFEFNPSVITIKKGEPVTLEFTALDVVMGFKLPDFGVRTDVIADDAMRRELVANGVAAEAVEELNALGKRYPQLPRALHLAYDAGDAAAEASPLAHALWMFVADIIAALVPVILFALLPMNEARYVSLAATAAVLVVLGIGRAKIGKRRMLSTTLQTLGIAAAAGAAGPRAGLSRTSRGPTTPRPGFGRSCRIPAIRLRSGWPTAPKSPGR